MEEMHQTHFEGIDVIEIIFVKGWESEFFIEKCEIEVIFMISRSHSKRVAEGERSELLEILVSLSAIVLVEFVSIIA